jgi:hypothetical protein
MKTITKLVAFAFTLSTSVTFADFQGIVLSPERATSSDGIFQVVITPFQGFPKAPGACHAQMFKKDGERYSLVWSRNLINDYRPCELLVTNKGELITLDDSQNLGTLPIVIYSSIGGLKYVSRIEDFPELKNNKEIPTTESGFRWRESSVYFLSEATQSFIVVAPQKEPIVIKISNGLRVSPFPESPDTSKRLYGFEWSVIEAEIKKKQKSEMATPR